MLTDRLAEFISRESQRSHGVRVTESTEALRLVLGLCLHSKPRAFTYILCLPGEWKFWNVLKQSPGSLWETPVSTHLTAWTPLAMPISWWPKGMWTHVLRCNIEAYLTVLHRYFKDTKTEDLWQPYIEQVYLWVPFFQQHLLTLYLFHIYVILTIFQTISLLVY